MATHSSTLAKKFHGWSSLVGYSPWGRKKTQLSNFTFLPSKKLGSFNFMSIVTIHSNFGAQVSSRSCFC